MSSLLPQAQRPYRLGVGMVLINNATGQVFTARRIDTREHAWQFPQGGIDDNEEPRATALRELGEEIGTDKADIIAESREWLAYDLPPDLADTCWKGRYRGQKQKWFALRFLGRDEDIDLATDHPEFCEWRWMDLEEVPTLIVPFKRGLYDQVIEEFRSVVRPFRR